MVGAQTRDEKTTSVPSSSLHSLANEAFAEVIFCRIKNNNMAAL
jgi:cobalamin biosynthesis Co2+ chelatase CbiK